MPPYLPAFRQGTRFQAIARLLMGFFVLTYLAGGAIFVDAAIERTEFYSGTCLALDPDCRVGANAAIEIADGGASLLNLSLHLSGTLQFLPLGTAHTPGLSSVLVAVVPTLPVQTFPNRIYHPPRTA